MNSPTWRASCWCFTTTPTEGYPRDGESVGRVSPRSGTRRCKGMQVLDRFGLPRVQYPTSCVVCIAFDDDCPKGVPVRPYIVWEDRFTWMSKSGTSPRVLPEYF
jgi:hypothetical protein